VSEFEDAAGEGDVPSDALPIDETDARDQADSSASEVTSPPPAEDPGGEQPEAEAEAQEPAAPPEPVAEGEQEPSSVGEQEAEQPEAPEPVAEEHPEAREEGPVSLDETELVEGDVEEFEPAPRVRPEIPGADLTPDIIPEGDDFLDAEARAAMEADAEAAAAAAEQEDRDEPQPIADAAIDLAAGARYTATGKRKTAVARVILKPGTGVYSINGRNMDTAFPRETLQRVIRQPLEAVGYESRMDVVARMHGGGVAAQAGALRHGISRALLEADPHLRGELKRRGFLTRDPRVKERKKAGLKKARKRPQFSKR
jgi:small subunit ribosomal protein S9